MQSVQGQLSIKKGITLIELLAAMSIIIMLLAAELSVFSWLIKNRKENSVAIRNNFYCKEAFMYMEEQLGKAQKVRIINNQIELIRIVNENGVNITYSESIYFYNENLIIRYYRNGEYKGQNNILTKINKFSFKLISRVLYISIGKNGQELERCFVVRVL